MSERKPLLTVVSRGNVFRKADIGISLAIKRAESSGISEKIACLIEVSTEVSLSDYFDTFDELTPTVYSAVGDTGKLKKLLEDNPVWLVRVSTPKEHQLT